MWLRCGFALLGRHQPLFPSSADIASSIPARNFNSNSNIILDTRHFRPFRRRHPLLSVCDFTARLDASLRCSITSTPRQQHPAYDLRIPALISIHQSANISIPYTPHLNSGKVIRTGSCYGSRLGDRTYHLFFHSG